MVKFYLYIWCILTSVSGISCKDCFLARLGKLARSARLHLEKKKHPNAYVTISTTFIIIQVTVPGPGRLISWNLYVTYNSQYPQVPIRLQIWRKVTSDKGVATESNFELLYEDRFILTSEHDGVIQVGVHSFKLRVPTFPQ